MGAARDELFRLRVTGTLESPKVGADTLPTITGTIDQVFRN